MAKKKTNRVGEVGFNNFGSKMEIIEYRGALDIDVYFPEYNWMAKSTQYSYFKEGIVKCPYEKRNYGAGYLGEGEYNASINKKTTKCYEVWNSMLQRCYDKKYQEKYFTYKDCEVCEEWHNFQNFAKWYEENYYEIENERMELDKDILVHGNKIYSPETCIFVPKRINTLFVKNDKNRGEYPIGVYYHKRDDVLEVSCGISENNKNRNIYLGRFQPNQVEEAFQCYKQFKENYIKQVANKYKDKIPNKLYEALINYKVREND